MVPTRWEDWSAAAEAAYVELAARCDSVVVVGLSMGGTLSVWLAERHPEIAALVLVNPLDRAARRRHGGLHRLADRRRGRAGSRCRAPTSPSRGRSSRPTPNCRCGRPQSLFAAAGEVAGRARLGDLPDPALLERAGPRGAPVSGDRLVEGVTGPVERDRAGAQLPRGHPRLRQGRDRGADRAVRHRCSCPPPRHERRGGAGPLRAEAPDS